MVRARVLALLSVFVGLILSAPSWAATQRAGSPAVVRLPGHVLPTLSHAKLIPARNASANGAKPITLTLVLKRDDQAGFDRYLKEVYDPHSKNFRHFLKQREIARRFGPSKRTYDATLAYLRANGFKLIEGSVNRLTLTVRGTRAQAERAFQVSIGEYTLGNRVFYANDIAPAMPENLASRVESLAGLSNLAKPKRDVEFYTAVIVSVCEEEIQAYDNYLDSQSSYRGYGVIPRDEWILINVDSLKSASRLKLRR